MRAIATMPEITRITAKIQRSRAMAPPVPGRSCGQTATVGSMVGDGDMETPATGSSHDDAIEIGVPLRTEHAATLRLMVASIAADAGFSIDEIDDLKLAVSEIFNVLLDAADDAADESLDGAPKRRAVLRLSVDGPTFTLDLTDTRAGGPLELDTLSAAILASIVDDHRVTDGVVTLVKHAVDTVR